MGLKYGLVIKVLVLFLRTQLARKEEEAKQADEGRSDEIPAHDSQMAGPIATCTGRTSE